MESTVYESFVLPSRGMIYDQEFDPHVTLRSMTTMEEMKRLSPTDTPYKTMSDIIETCMKNPLPIHVYDLCLGDYQFLLHRLRVVTYGPEYKMVYHCDKCNATTETIANLDTIPVNEWDTSVIDMQLITLPKTGHSIELKFQTPRDLDQIAYKTKEMKRRTKQNLDYSILFSLMSVIKKVDGEVLDPISLEEFVKGLPNKDTNYIANKLAELNRKVGLDNIISITCSGCGAEATAPFRITSEFFGPTTD